MRILIWIYVDLFIYSLHILTVKTREVLLQTWRSLFRFWRHSALIACATHAANYVRMISFSCFRKDLIWILVHVSGRMTCSSFKNLSWELEMHPLFKKDICQFSLYYEVDIENVALVVWLVCGIRTIVPKGCFPVFRFLHVRART